MWHASKRPPPKESCNCICDAGGGIGGGGVGGGGGRPAPPTPGTVAVPCVGVLPHSLSKLREFTSGDEISGGVGGGETALPFPQRARAGVGAIVKSALAPSLSGIPRPFIPCVTGILLGYLALAVIGVSQRKGSYDGAAVIGGDSAGLPPQAGAPGAAILRPCNTGMRHTAEIEGMETDGLKTRRVLGGATIAPCMPNGKELTRQASGLPLRGCSMELGRVIAGGGATPAGIQGALGVEAGVDALDATFGLPCCDEADTTLSVIGCELRAGNFLLMPGGCSGMTSDGCGGVGLLATGDIGKGIGGVGGSWIDCQPDPCCGGRGDIDIFGDDQPAPLPLVEMDSPGTRGGL